MSVTYDPKLIAELKKRLEAEPLPLGVVERDLRSSLGHVLSFAKQYSSWFDNGKNDLSHTEDGWAYPIALQVWNDREKILAPEPVWTVKRNKLYLDFLDVFNAQVGRPYCLRVDSLGQLVTTTGLPQSVREACIEFLKNEQANKSSYTVEHHKNNPERLTVFENGKHYADVLIVDLKTWIDKEASQACKDFLANEITVKETDLGLQAFKNGKAISAIWSRRTPEEFRKLWILSPRLAEAFAKYEEDQIQKAKDAEVRAKNPIVVTLDPRQTDFVVAKRNGKQLVGAHKRRSPYDFRDLGKGYFAQDRTQDELDCYEAFAQFEERAEETLHSAQIERMKKYLQSTNLNISWNVHKIAAQMVSDGLKAPVKVTLGTPLKKDECGTVSPVQANYDYMKDNYNPYGYGISTLPSTWLNYKW